MKTDLYTKTMLTLIALFLAVLAADKVYDVVVPEAQAATTKDYYWTCGHIPEWEEKSLGYKKGTIDHIWGPTEWWNHKIEKKAKEGKWEDMVLTALESPSTTDYSNPKSNFWFYYCGKTKQPPKPASKQPPKPASK